MKLAILNDTHCGVRNSSEIFIRYQERFYDEVFFPYLEENGITQILHLGDYYEHRKYINFKALHSNRKTFLSRLRERGLSMDIIPGNHDVYYRNTNDLNSLKELMGHYVNEVNIVMKPTTMNYDGFKIDLIPWINSENYDATMAFVQKSKTRWCAGHFEFAGFEMYKGQKSESGMDSKIFSKYEKVLSGHYHTKSESGNVVYLGSQMEFTWSDVDDPKYFHVIDTEATGNRRLECIRNPLTLFKRIEYNDKEIDYANFDYSTFDYNFVRVVVVDKKKPEVYDKFIDNIRARPIHDLKIDDNYDAFAGFSIDSEDVMIEDTSTLLDTYIDAVDTELEKSKLRHMMKSLLIEAQSREIV